MTNFQNECPNHTQNEYPRRGQIHLSSSLYDGRLVNSNLENYFNGQIKKIQSYTFMCMCTHC